MTMRTADYELNGERFSEIPQKGLSPAIVQQMVMKRCSETQSDYHTGTPMAKPGTKNHPEAVEAYIHQMRNQNGNLVDGKMFPGAFKTEADVIAMTADILGKKDKDSLHAGFMLNGGTESTIQSLWMMKEKYFLENYDIKLGEEGLFNAVTKIRENYNPKFYPHILAPLEMHFALSKAVDLSGLGKQTIKNYGLNEDFTTDYKSLADAVESIYKEGGEIAVNYCVAGDTQKGKVQDTAKIDEIVAEIADKYNKPRPPTVVDAAAQFLFLGMMRDSKNYDLKMPNWDFNVDNVQAIVCDWHKNQIPYNAGALVLRDGKDILLTDQEATYLHNTTNMEMNEVSEAERIKCGATSTIPTSRGAGGAYATYAYLLNEGKENLRKTKEDVWKKTKRFAEGIRQSDHYELMSDPQTTVVAFRLKDKPHLHKNVYDTINQDPNDNVFISHGEAGNVKSLDDMRAFKAMADDERKEALYSGLHVHLMEHNTEKGVYETIDKLERTAHSMKTR